MHLHADHVEYDGDRFVISAHGNVKLQMENGDIATARFFSMDVKANRYLLAGHVQISGKNVALEGAALSNFLTFHRIYFLSSNSTPDRITYLDDHFTDVSPGRDMPADAFAFPDGLAKHPLLTAKDVVISPNATLRFALAEFNTGIVTIPVPDYVLNLSKNPNFAQNSLAGASFDASYPFAGSKNSSTALHIRTGGGNGIFGALEQRFVWDKSYLVDSLSPLNHSLKQYNLLGLKTISPTLQIQGFAQEQAFQRGFSTPLNASLNVSLTATQALKHSYLQYSLNQAYQSLLSDPHNACNCHGDATHVFVPNHPITMQFSWLSFDQKVLKLPLKYRLRSGYNYNHDQYGIIPPDYLNAGPFTYTAISPQYASLVGVGVQTVTNSFIGATVYTPSYKLTHDSHGNDVYFNASFDAQRKWYSLPHQVNTTTSAFSLSRAYGTKLSTFLSYTIAHTGDQYGDNQRNVYPIPTAGSPVFGSGDFAEFKGFSTLRTLSQGIVFTPNPNFNASLTVAETDNFPRSVPTVFGPAPLSITGEVRARLRRHLLIDITRTYYYNYGTQRFSPGYGLLIGG